MIILLPQNHAALLTAIFLAYNCRSGRGIDTPAITDNTIAYTGRVRVALFPAEQAKEIPLLMKREELRNAKAAEEDVVLQERRTGF